MCNASLDINLCIHMIPYKALLSVFNHLSSNLGSGLHIQREKKVTLGFSITLSNKDPICALCAFLQWHYLTGRLSDVEQLSTSIYFFTCQIGSKGNSLISSFIIIFFIRSDLDPVQFFIFSLQDLRWVGGWAGRRSAEDRKAPHLLPLQSRPWRGGAGKRHVAPPWREEPTPNRHCHLVSDSGTPTAC